MKTETFLKIDQEMRDRILAALTKATSKEVVDTTQEASEEDTGTFEVIISTADFDRHGERVLIEGWELENYQTNPIVLWSHAWDELPIGICDSVEKQDGKLVAKGRFAPASANPLAQQVRKLYDLGVMRATSVGFIAKEFTDDNTITKAELLEFSFVSVPANPYALSLAKTVHLNCYDLMVKGLLCKDGAADSETPPEKPSATDPVSTDPNPEKPDKPQDENDTTKQIAAELQTMLSQVTDIINQSSKKINELTSSEKEPKEPEEDNQSANPSLEPDKAEGSAKKIKRSITAGYKEVIASNDEAYVLARKVLQDFSTQLGEALSIFKIRK